jgi:hypothetical protein
LKRLPVAITHADPETLSFLSSDRYPTASALALASDHRLAHPDVEESLRRWAAGSAVSRKNRTAQKQAGVVTQPDAPLHAILLRPRRREVGKWVLPRNRHPTGFLSVQGQAGERLSPMASIEHRLVNPLDARTRGNGRQPDTGSRCGSTPLSRMLRHLAPGR